MKLGTLRPAALAAALGACAAMTSAQAPTPNLAGRWKLNVELSDDVEAKALAAVGENVTVGKKGGESDRLALRKVILGMLPALGMIEIEQSPTEVKLIDADDEVRTFYFGREHVREGRVGKLKCTTEWKGEQLLVTEVSDSGKLTELLTAVPARHQILHVVRLEDDRLRTPLEVRLAYDAVAPRSPKP